MPKSYFRRPDESGSESSSDEEEEDESASLSRDLSNISVSNGSGGSHESIAIDRTRGAGLEALGRDLLIHALLEERCLNQVRNERAWIGRAEPDIRQEAHRRYQVMCQHLAPLNLFSAGLEGSEHDGNRQWVRDGLDSLPLTGGPSTSRALQRGQRAQMPGPLRRYLTEADATPARASLNSLSSPASLFNTSTQLYQQPAITRYHGDFEQMSLLGKGGYGEVFQARHLVDGQVYAVKRVPIHPAMLRRAQVEGSEGEAAMEEILKEVRSLSRLSHPNIVRYNNSWIEKTPMSDFSASSNPEVASDAVLGAAESISFGTPSLRRIRTETDTLEDIGMSFESRSRDITTSQVEVSNGHLLTNIDSHASDSFISATDSGSRKERQLSIPGPTVALYVQMAVYPITLAEFISPKKAATDIQPLAHCFHLEPSIRILLAILDGVEYMHSQNVVHRDLKPANVFLKHEDSPKANPTCIDLSSCSDCQSQKMAAPANLGVCIGDFGLVTTIAQTNDVNSPSSKGAVGTEIYRPATSKDNISPRLDIFAVGVIACELLCKFDTQMERRQTLHDLRHSKLPKHFGSCAGRHASRLKECIASMLSDEEKASIAEVKDTLESMLIREEAVLRRSST